MEIVSKRTGKLWRLFIVASILLFVISYKPVFAKISSSDDYKSEYERTYYLSYSIEKGDTLWSISQRYGVTVESLQRANNIKGSLIIAGATLKIPQTATVSYEDREVVYKTSEKQKTTAIMTMNAAQANIAQKQDDDRYWLAKIIEAEAGIEGIKGKVAVGAVVLNRVQADWFPDTIQEVIFQKYNGVYQFSPVGNGRIDEVEPSEDAYNAADRALAGEDPTNGALYFYNPKISKSTFFKKKDLLAIIGNHQFFQ